MRTQTLAIFTALIVLCTASGALGQGPSGTLTFSGAGVDLLPSSTFEPASYAGAQGSWTFFDVTDAIGIIVIENETDPTRANFVAVGEDGGETWTAVAIAGPIIGLTINGDTITFTNVEVPQTGAIQPKNLILNGSLTRGVQVDVESTSVGSVKQTYVRTR